MIKLILGAGMAVVAWTYPTHYSPILFVEGMILANMGIFERRIGSKSYERR